MDRWKILAMSAISALGLALLPGSAIAQQKSIKEQIAGTWTFVSALDVYPDGRKNDRWGTNPKGIFIFDGNGRFAPIHHTFRPTKDRGRDGRPKGLPRNTRNPFGSGREFRYVYSQRGREGW